MKFAPVFTAVLVSVFLYFLVVDRDRLLEFAGVASGSESAEISMSAETQDPNAPLIKVVVTRSEARVLDNAVILRGETEAARQVDVRAETSGLVISEPLRKGASVAIGDLLCELDFTHATSQQLVELQRLLCRGLVHFFASSGFQIAIRQRTVRKVSSPFGPGSGFLAAGKII